MHVEKGSVWRVTNVPGMPVARDVIRVVQYNHFINHNESIIVIDFKWHETSLARAVGNYGKALFVKAICTDGSISWIDFSEFTCGALVNIY